MTPRLFAIAVCLLASKRWTRLRLVAAALACELVAGDAAQFVACRKMIALASCVWLTPSLAFASIGAALATRSRAFVAAFVGAQSIAGIFMATRSCPVAWVALLSCAASAAQLAQRTLPADTERAAALALLVGNVATCAMMLLVGVERAYRDELVLISNEITHIAISAIVLWAMRR